MKRVVSIMLVYALFAALAVAAPLSASEEAGVADPLQPAAELPAEPPAEPPAAAGEPAALQPASPASEPPATPQAEADPAPAAAPPAPVEPASPAPAQIRDTAPVAEAAKRVKELKAIAAASAAVTISDFQFAPASVTVKVGDTVTWSNAGPTSHSATASGGSFDTGIFPEGESRSHTFEEAGTFSYICTPHPQMKGTVTVEAAAAQEGGEGGSSDDGTDAATDGGSTAADDGSGTESDSGSTLPATGLDAAGLLAVGLMTLALGALLRRRSGGAG
jgi:plastocyanin